MWDIFSIDFFFFPSQTPTPSFPWCPELMLAVLCWEWEAEFISLSDFQKLGRASLVTHKNYQAAQHWQARICRNAEKILSSSWFIFYSSPSLQPPKPFVKFIFYPRATIPTAHSRSLQGFARNKTPKEPSLSWFWCQSQAKIKNPKKVKKKIRDLAKRMHQVPLISEGKIFSRAFQLP